MQARATLGDVVERFAEVTTTRCLSKLIHLACGVSEDGANVQLEAMFGEGRGDNPDDYDQQGYRVIVSMPPLGRDDLDDGVDLDVFADELRRMSQRALVARFRSALDDLEGFKLLRGTHALSVAVERVT